MNTPLMPRVPDTTSPPITSGLTTTAAGGSQINLTWTASTDNVGVSGYQVERCQGAGCTNFAQVGTSTGTAFSNTGLASLTSYTYRVRAVDAAGNLERLLEHELGDDDWLPGRDAAAPAPSNVAATAISTTQINLAWTASTDNVGVTQYRIERCQGASCTNFAQIGTAPSAELLEHRADREHDLPVPGARGDAAPNLSGYSDIVNRATLAADTTVPSTPTGLAATANSPTQISLTWIASTDNVGVTGYQVQRCQGAGCTNYTQVATPTVPSFTDTDRSPNTTYRYRVRAVDAAGNLSAFSTVVTVTTPRSPTRRRRRCRRGRRRCRWVW